MKQRSHKPNIMAVQLMCCDVNRQAEQLLTALLEAQIAFLGFNNFITV